MREVTTAAMAPEAQVMYQRLGEITRTLHEALRQLGYDKQIEASLGSLPDARARLDFIARLTGEAAEKVLNTVLRADPAASALAGGELLGFVHDVRETAQGTSTQLTDIMLAQDFHDLTGQTVRKVVDVAAGLEESLVKLLLETSSTPGMVERGPLDGPVADAARPDVVNNQAQVDDLLESLGF